MCYKSAILQLLLLLIPHCLCYHVLITSGMQSYSHWTTLLHISKGLLSMKDDNGSHTHFISYFIEEQNDKYLDTVRREKFNPHSYQVLYTPFAVKFDMKSFQKMDVFSKLIFVMSDFYKHASFEVILAFLNQTQSEPAVTNNINALNRSMNKGQKNKYNNIEALVFNQKVSLCLVDYFDLVTIKLCEMFHVPTIVRFPPYFLSKVENYNFRNTFIWYTDPMTFDIYPDLTNGTVMTYRDRSMQTLINTGFLIAHELLHYIIGLPKIVNDINQKLAPFNKAFNIRDFDNGWFGVWNGVVVISNLGPPFTPIFYQRPRLKQFGFLLYPSTNSDKSSDLELWQWMNKSASPILFISMGSVCLLPQNVLQTIYNKLVSHSFNNHYRVLWGLREQQIYDNQTNEKLEKPYFKIMKWVPQMQLLQDQRIKLFLTHSGTNGLTEALFHKTLCLFYPISGDQFFNAKRAVDLDIGLMIQDRETFMDLTDNINVLMLNKSTASFYQNKLNKVHRMLMGNGGISEAVDLIEYIAEFGTKHLICTSGHKYDCNQTYIPWHQRTILDIYVIVLVAILMIAAMLKICCFCCCRNETKRKHKAD